MLSPANRSVFVAPMGVTRSLVNEVACLDIADACLDIAKPRCGLSEKFAENKS